MEAHDTRVLLATLGTLQIGRAVTDADALAATRPLGMVNQSMLGLTRFRGQTPWERHPGGDELLFVLEGSVEVTIRAANGRASSFPLAEGGTCVVPRDLWHRQNAAIGVALLFATPVDGTEHSWEDEPR